MTIELKKIFTRLPEKKADLIVLILTSQYIETQIERQGSLFDILINSRDEKKAFLMIEAYQKENRFFRLKQQVQAFPISSFKSYTAFSIMGLLLFIHLVSVYYNIHEALILKFGASSLYILQGETYRAITALFLHADVQHLAGNLAGLLIFAAPLISISGYGTGSLMLLVTGTTGNLLNAHLYQTAHLSIGASTAVMGAAGLLAAFEMTENSRPVSLNNLMPLIAGAILVTLFSQGENTDVWAHILGFFSGVVSGIIFFPLNRFIQSYMKNPMALILTLLILITSLLEAI